MLTCGKNSNGREFAPIAVRLSADMIYEVAPEFDLSGWREHVTNARPQRRRYTVERLREIPFPQRKPTKKQVVKLVCDDIGCSSSRAYELVDEATSADCSASTKRNAPMQRPELFHDFSTA